jgi:hypothetical protein
MKRSYPRSGKSRRTTNPADFVRLGGLSTDVVVFGRDPAGADTVDRF